MKKAIFIIVFAVFFIYAACSGGRRTARVSHTPPPITGDSAMGGDAMKKDSTRP